MNITITGATGFIGKYLCRELIDSHQLIILTRDIGRAKSQLPYKNINLLDLALPEIKLKEELKNTEVFIHLAANRPKNKNSNQKIDSYLKVLQLTDKILNLLPREKNIRIINVSSKSIYGPNNILPYDETQIPKPESLYGLSKLIGEQQIDIYALKSNFSILHLRLGQVIGWGDSQKNNVTTFLNNALNKRIQQVWGHGNGSRCYIYVKDVVNAITAGIERKETGPFNMVLPKSISHLDLAKNINKIFDNNKLEFLDDKVSDTRIEEIDIANAKKLLNWVPRYAKLETILLDMKKDYEEKNIDWI